MRLKPVEEQVVVLMGASSNIDHETALRFTEVGARVIVRARCEKGLPLWSKRSRITAERQ